MDKKSRPRFLTLDEDMREFLDNVSPCDCGRDDCLTCWAQAEVKKSAKSNAMPVPKEFEDIVSKFENGPAYLNAWNRDAKLREEFEGDFEAWCHYKNALENGQIKSLGGRSK